MMQPAKIKWRPTLSMIILAVLVFVMVLPLAGVVFFRFYENQLIRQTESELISQSAVFAALMAQHVRKTQTPDMPRGRQAPEKLPTTMPEPYRPVNPRLDLARDDIHKPRPDPIPSTRPAHSTFIAVGRSLQPVMEQTQNVTLAGFRILDPFGTVISGRYDIGQSFAHVQEIKAAMAGNYASVLRQRLSNQPAPLSSLSRGTSIRIFTAMPVILENHVVGVIYASRTPSNILKELYLQRDKVILAALFVMAITFAIGFIFSRTITRPIRKLSMRTSQIGSGDRSAIQPLKHHGSKEIFDLSQGLLDMATKLSDRTDYIASFATHVSHELKSPLTAIRGAVELMLDNSSKMSAVERQQFLENILGDTQRLTALLDRLQDLAKADNPFLQGSTRLGEIINHMRELYPGINIEVTGNQDIGLAMSAENAAIVFSNLIDNAGNHGADCVSINVTTHANRHLLTVSDDGSGVSDGNAEKIFDLFFTTRRDNGGTGMGLGIVHSMLKAHKGSIKFIPGTKGATFELVIPRA